MKYTILYTLEIEVEASDAIKASNDSFDTIKMFLDVDVPENVSTTFTNENQITDENGTIYDEDGYERWL